MVTKVEIGIALNSRNKMIDQASKILIISQASVIIVENGDINEKIAEVGRKQVKKQILLKWNPKYQIRLVRNPTNQTRALRKWASLR